VISSEEAIAKGIRRIIALTGPEASRALKKAAALEERVKSIEKEKGDQGKAIVELGDEISQASIPYWKKDDLRNILKEKKKSLDDKDRATKAAILNQVVEDVKRELVETPPSDPFIVKVLPAQNNTKALDAALKQVKALSPATSALFFTVDDQAGKVYALSTVSAEGVQKGLKANEWVAAVAKIVDGKGGGKAESAQAQGKNVNFEQAVKTAVEFAKLKLC